jgi:hypothetical protein
VVPSDDARAALAVFPPHDFPDDLLVEGTRGDHTNQRDQEAVLGHSHLVHTLIHCSIDAKYPVGIVIDSVGVVVICEGVPCIDGEGGRGSGGSGGGRRLRIGSGAILLGGLLWKKLQLGRHGGVVVFVVGGSNAGGGGIGVVSGGVVDISVALFAVNLLVVMMGGGGRDALEDARR